MRDRGKNATSNSHTSNGKQSAFITLLGLVRLSCSLWLLVWNETRLDLSVLAKRAVEVSANNKKDKANGKLVYVTGNIVAKEPLGDNLYLEPGEYIFIDRIVEMFSWEESSHAHTQERGDGSKIEITTYSYQRVWTRDPMNSSRFQSPQHRNPAKAVPDKLYKASGMQVGTYHLDANRLRISTRYLTSCTQQKYVHYVDNSIGISFPKDGLLALNAQNVCLTNQTTLRDRYLEINSKSPSVPEIGDLRVCYQVMPANTLVTVFGKLAGDSLNLYQDWRASLYRVIPGDRKQAIATLRGEHISSSIMFRFVSFFLMSIGLAAFYSFKINVLQIGAELNEEMRFTNAMVATYFLISAAIVLLNHLLAIALVAAAFLAYAKATGRWRLGR